MPCTGAGEPTFLTWLTHAAGPVTADVIRLKSMTAVDAEPDRSIAKLVRAFRRGLITETELRHQLVLDVLYHFRESSAMLPLTPFPHDLRAGLLRYLSEIEAVNYHIPGPSEFCGGTDDLPPHDSDAQAEALRDLVPQLRAWLVSDN